MPLCAPTLAKVLNMVAIQMYKGYLIMIILFTS